MNTSNQNGQFIKALAIVHLVLLIGQVGFLAVVAIIHKMGFVKPSLDIDNTYIWFLFLSIGILLSGGMLFRTRLSLARSKTTLDEKLNAYKAALIIQYATVEGAFIFSSICFLMTGSRWLIYFSFFVIIFFFMLRPNPAKVQKQLDLSSHEIASLGKAV